ncbi:MAG: hypothetical protein R3C27_02055, partial [Hyphomonadaceae bacterium]
GRGSAIAVYVCYLLSIPSASLFALLGVIIALSTKSGSGPLARSHLNYQTRIWFTAFWWTIGFAILWGLGVLTAVIGVGFVLIGIAWLGAGALFIWFTVVSLLGLLALLDNRPR